jgi:hypothetical protein
MDGFTYNNSLTNTTGTFINTNQTLYGQAANAILQFNYPMTTTPTIDQKTMVFINGGYAATSPAPISFSIFQTSLLLWCNP